MGECCGPSTYDSTFDGRFARRLARRYRRRGLNRVQRRLIDFLVQQGIEGATVLEIGGGVGDVQVELLRRGAARVTNLEISPNYESEAAALLEAAGLSDKVERRLLDIARAPEEAEPADVVVLHRVVCCYPDYQALLAAAGSHAERLLVFSHPPGTLLMRAMFGFDNLVRRLRGKEFRAFVHPPETMVGVLLRQGLSVAHRSHGWEWDVVGLQRNTLPS